MFTGECTASGIAEDTQKTTFPCRGVFTPRLAYALGRARSASYPLLDCDLDKSLAELCGTDVDANTITIIADVTR